MLSICFAGPEARQIQQNLIKQN